MIVIKKILFNCLREFLYLLSFIFPVKKNRILFTAFNGKQYSCNPKYICQYIMKYYDDKYDIIWVLNENQCNISSKVKRVKFSSLSYYYYYFTSKIIVTNMGFRSFIKKPLKQVRIETWHGGGAYKKVDLDVRRDAFLEYKLELVSEELDFYISSNKKFTEIMGRAQKVSKEKFLAIGMPRNDLFFLEKQIDILKRDLKIKFKLNDYTDIILYAPTWRDDGRDVDLKNLIDAVDKINKISSKKYYVLYRGHHADNKKKIYNNFTFLNVSDYPDMQELLCLADILITDYSSCMWDFSLMYKPCFIFANDIAKYKQERDFYTPMEKWPFPIATNVEELIYNILNFDESNYVKKVKQHHEELGSYEDGHACEKVCKIINDICDGREVKL